jgi:hypothetical protein
MIRQRTIEIPISSIILDEDIYPRKGIYHRRVGMFAENIRDGFKFDPIEVEPVPDKPGWTKTSKYFRIVLVSNATNVGINGKQGMIFYLMKQFG